MNTNKTPKPDLSRRRFLASLGLGGLGLLLPQGAAAAPAAPATSATPAVVELATLHDLSKCVGCGACVEACRETNAHKFPEPTRPFPTMYPSSVKVEDWSTRRQVTDRLTPYNWLYIQSARGQHLGQRFEVHIPRRCMHCQNPPCANLCPWGAAARETNGVVRIDDQICLGGAKCKTVCPWAIPMRQTGVGLYLKLMPRFGGNGVMYKCDRCHDRLAKGQKPACVESCPYDVQEIGPRAEIIAKAHALARNMNGYIYGETENGGTNSLYVSPVPFEILDAAVTTGPGKPDLSEAPDMMADETRMAYAALFAPVAGIAAGVLRLGSRLVNGEGDGDKASNKASNKASDKASGKRGDEGDTPPPPPPDAGQPDAGQPNAGQPDAGQPDDSKEPWS